MKRYFAVIFFALTVAATVGGGMTHAAEQTTSKARSGQKEYIETISEDPEVLSDGYLALVRVKAEQGHREAMWKLARHFDRLGFRNYRDQADIWYEKHAESGSSRDQFNVGLRYWRRNTENLKAERWFKAAARGSDKYAAEANLYLGYLYESNEEFHDFDKARVAMTRAAELGSAEGAYELSRLYEIAGTDFKSSNEEVKWLMIAATRRDSNAQLGLGNAYYAGSKVPKDLEKAVELWRLAGEQGNVEAIQNMAKVGVPDDKLPKFPGMPAPYQEREFRTQSKLTVTTPREFPVWYGTNRKPVDAADASKGYTGVIDSATHYGVSKVLIPRGHEFGQVKSSWYQKFVVREDGTLRIVGQHALNDSDFSKGASDWARRWREDSEPSMLIIIHGFNVTFDEAIIRAAQIGYDLKVPGPVMAFSWPSIGDVGPRDYTTDENTVVASQPAIHDFLAKASAIATKANIKKVHLIAHSMGNRGFLETILYGNSVRPMVALNFDQILLAAPDMDKIRFGQLINVLASSERVKSKRTTLYVSPRDWALAASEWVHRNSSIGRTPPITVVPNIQTIEVSGIDLGMLGHSYIFEAEKVLSDIRELMEQNSEPGKRLYPRRSTNDAGAAYWQIAK